MKSATLVLIAFILLCGSSSAQLRGGGFSGGGRGGPMSPAPMGAPGGQANQVRQAPANPQQPRGNQPAFQPGPPNAPMVSPQLSRGSQPAVQPQVHTVPGRPGTIRGPHASTVIAPPLAGSRWFGSFAPSRRHHWHRDRFFKHRHGSVFFVGWPGYYGYGYVEPTVVVTQVAPGVIREDRRYVDAPPADARVREPGQLAPFDPTPQEVVDRMLVLADIRRNDVIYDLGSGDGRLLITAAKKYGIRGVGFEIEPGLVKLARENARKTGVEKLVQIRQQDFLSADLSSATVVTLYLSYDGNLAVREQLQRQLKPGTRVVSYTFDMGDWPPKIAESYRDAAGEVHAIYLWEIGNPALASRNSEPMLEPYPTRSGPLIIEVQ